MLKIYYNDAIDWVVAESPEDATEVWEKHTGEDAADYDMEWLEETDPLSIHFVEEYDPKPAPDGADITILDNGSVQIIASPAAWIKYNGRGFLCSTEW